jgi:hypothetical protein
MARAGRRIAVAAVSAATVIGLATSLGPRETVDPADRRQQAVEDFADHQERRDEERWRQAVDEMDAERRRKLTSSAHPSPPRLRLLP